MAPRSLRDRAQRNLDALRLLKQLEADGRDATPDERRILARYSGWGALSRVFDNWPGDLKDTAEELRTLVSDDEWKALRASTPNAHYTSLEVIDAMWQGALRLGIPDDARVLEPALGVGHFFGLQPAHIRGPRTGVELEPLSARLARALYPDSGIRIGAFQDTPHLGGYDLVIGNVPFGRYGVRDSHYHADPVVTRSIHDYFLGRALDEIRPGGIVALITSRYTMDKVNDSFRRWADERANLVAALRLPSTAFERSAGTEVVTDILFLQRRFEGAGRGVDWIDTGRFEAKGFHDPINTYFLEHPEHVLGALDLGRGLYNRYELRVEGEQLTLEGEMALAVPEGTREIARRSRGTSHTEPQAPSLGSQAPRTTRSTLASIAAPAHMGQGSMVTYSSASTSRQLPSIEAARRTATISAWAVGSTSCSRRLCARASAEIRSVVYQRSLPLATRNLPIVLGELGGTAGVIGASVLAAEGVLVTDP